jgi:hypothetical protein
MERSLLGHFAWTTKYSEVCYSRQGTDSYCFVNFLRNLRLRFLLRGRIWRQSFLLPQEESNSRAFGRSNPRTRGNPLPSFGLRCSPIRKFTRTAADQGRASSMTSAGTPARQASVLADHDGDKPLHGGAHGQISARHAARPRSSPAMMDQTRSAGESKRVAARSAGNPHVFIESKKSAFVLV